MTWDAIAALGVVVAAALLLVRQMTREKQACSRCEVVVTQRRMQDAQLPPVTQKSVASLAISRAKSR